MSEKSHVGCLLGTAVGDALGLPYEGLSARRAARLFPDRRRYHLLLNRGMVSDDTEHVCFTAQALMKARGDAELFRKRLARSLRWWLLALPAGVGSATARSIMKLWLGWPPDRSGIYSAGNGPAMRSAIIGVVYRDDLGALRRFVEASTRVTHTDPKAYFAALAVALAAAHSSRHSLRSAADFCTELQSLLDDEGAAEFLELVAGAAASAARAEPVAEFAAAIGSPRGISGYSYHTVPCVLQTWFRRGEDFAAGIDELIAAGGDTDTTAAIFGAIVGARVGKEGLPADWLRNIVEWPRSVTWIERLGRALAKTPREPSPRVPRYFMPGVVVRNFVFLILVLMHGLRRLAPPY